MPDMQTAAPTPLPVMLEASSASEEMDYALGCECAYPSLQIERWLQEASGATDAG